jgi:hypothetical protein
VAKLSAMIANYGKARFHIHQQGCENPGMMSPSLKINNISIVINANLPANWLKKYRQTDSMTFGKTIYFKGDNLNLNLSHSEFTLLMHELKHTEQIKRLGECRFAAKYGEEFARYGYARMPLEKEADDFAAKALYKNGIILVTEKHFYRVKQV